MTATMAKILLEREIDVCQRLRFDALAGVDHQERTFACRQRSTDLIGEVDMAGGIDQIELIE